MYVIKHIFFFKDNAYLCDERYNINSWAKESEYILYKILGSPLRWQKGNNLRHLCPAYVVTFTPTEGFFLSQFVKI